MPLTQANLTVNGSWQLQKSNGTALKPTRYGPDSESFSLQALGISLTTWDQVFLEEYTIFLTTPTGLAAVLVAGGSLTVSTTYYYEVTAVADQQETNVSSEVSATPTSGNQTIKLTWNALQGAQSYNVYRGTAAGSENVLVANVPAPTGASTVSYSDTGGAGTSATPPSGAPPAYIEFDLHSFTNLVGESVTAGHALGIILYFSGPSSILTLTPGSSNGLTWFFSGTTPAINLPGGKGGVFAACTDPAGTGQVIDSTDKTLRITNTGTSTLSVTVAVLLGP